MAGENPFIKFADEDDTAVEDSTNLQDRAIRMSDQQDQDDSRGRGASKGQGQGQGPNAATSALNAVLAYMGRTSSGKTRGKSKVGNHFFDGNRNIRELLRKKVITRDQAKLLGDFNDMTPAQVRAMVEANPKKYSSFDPTPRDEEKATDARRFPGDPNAVTPASATTVPTTVPTTGPTPGPTPGAPTADPTADPTGDPTGDPTADAEFDSWEDFNTAQDGGEVFYDGRTFTVGGEKYSFDSKTKKYELTADADADEPRPTSALDPEVPASDYSDLYRAQRTGTRVGEGKEDRARELEGQMERAGRHGRLGEGDEGGSRGTPIPASATTDPATGPTPGGAPTAKPSQFDGYRKYPDGSWGETAEGRIKRMDDEAKVAEADMRRRIAMSPSTPQGEHGSPERALYWKTKQTMVGEKARGNVKALTKSQIENPEEHAAEQYKKYNLENKTPGTNTISGEFEYNGKTYKRDRVIITGPTGFQPDGQQASGWNDKWSVKGEDGKWKRKWNMSDKDALTITGSEGKDGKWKPAQPVDYEESRFKNMKVNELVDGQKDLQEQGWSTGEKQDFKNPKDHEIHVNDMRETRGESMNRTQQNTRKALEDALKRTNNTDSTADRDNFISTESHRMRNQKLPE